MKRFLPIVFAFIVITLILIVFGKQLHSLGVDSSFILGANVVLFILSSIGFFIQLKSAINTNPNVMMRGISGSMLAKFFLVIAAVLVYVMGLGGSINTGALLISFLLYLIYTTLEVVQLLKVLKKK